MKEKELDKLFAQKLSSRQFAFTEAHWEQVSGSIGGRRAGAWWIYLLLLMLLTSAGGAIFYYSHSADGATLQIRNIESELASRFESTASQSSPISQAMPSSFEDPSASSSDIGYTPTTNESPSAHSTETNTHSDKNELPSTSSNINDLSSSSSDYPPEASNEGDIETGRETQPSAPITPEPSLPQPVSSIQFQPVESSGNGIQIEDSGEDASGHGSSNDDTESAGPAQHSSDGNEALLASTAAFLASSVSNSQNIAIETGLDVQLEDLSLQSLKSKDAELRHNQELREDIEMVEGLRPEDLYVEKRSPWSLSVFGGAGISQRELSGGHPQYISKRDEEEKILPTIGGGIELHYHLGKFDFASGVNYSRYGEKPNYSPETTITPGIEESYVTQEIETGYWVVDSLWVFEDIDTIAFGVWQVDSTYFQGTDTIQVVVQDSIFITETHEFESVERAWFEYVEIPLMVGYTHAWRRFEVSVHGGVSLGILTRHGGSRIAPSLTSYEAEENQPDLRQTLLNYQLRLGVGYRILPGTTIIVEPAFRSMGASVFAGALNQRYRTYGLNIRLNYRF